MFRRMIMSLFLAAILSGTTAPGYQLTPKLYEEGQGKWEDIVLPKTYTLDYENIEFFLSQARERSEATVKKDFRYLAWKPGVRLFEILGPSRFGLLGRLGQKTAPITQESIGYFIEKIDSEAKAFELVMFFHSGVLLTGKADIESLMEGCRTSKVAQVAESMPKSFEPVCRFDPKRGAYQVSFCMYEVRNVFEAKYLVAPDGFIGSSLQNYVIGPTRISGWDGLSDEYERYRKTSEAFERPIAKPLENIAIKVMTNTELEKKGLAKGQENALRWLSSWGDVKEHAASIVEFLDAKGDMIDPSVKKRALLKLKSVGAGLLKEERITPTVPVGPKPIQRKKTFWPWPFLLIGTVVGIGVLYLVLLIKKKAISRGKSRAT